MPTLSPQVTPYYGGGQVVNPANVIRTSGAPSTKLTEDGLGTLAIDNSAAGAYILVSKSGGIDTWLSVEGSGGAGVFSTLTSTGATTLATTGASVNTFGNLTGATSLNLKNGSGASGWTSASGSLTFNSGVGALGISTDASATSVSIATGGAVKTTILGSTNTSSTTTVQAGSGNFNIASINTIQALSSAGVAVTNQLTNSDNTNAASNASYQVAVGGGSSGDPYIDFLVSGAGHYALGIDNSSSDDFVLAASGSLGTSNILTVTNAGALTAATTITATLGDITASNGNFVASASGTGLSLPVVTASGAASGTVNCNGRVGSVTFTSVSIAGNADLTLTLGNTSIAGSSTRLLYSMSGCTTGGAVSVKSVTTGANSCAWVVTNGTGLTTTTADITFDFIVLN